MLACQPNDLNTSSLGAKVALAQSGDSLQVTVYYTLRTADSAKFTVSSTNGQPAISKVGKSQAGNLVFMLLGPAEGETDTVSIKPIAYKAGQAFTQATITKTFTRSVTAPPNVVDSVAVQAAILNSKFLDTALVALTTGEMCPAELRDYRNGMLIVPRGNQSENCASVFNNEILADNARVIETINAGYPWTNRQDSIWRSSPPSTVELPKVFMSVAYIPSVTVDTFVFASDAQNVAIAAYRSSHPNFKWGE